MDLSVLHHFPIKSCFVVDKCPAKILFEKSARGAPLLFSHKLSALTEPQSRTWPKSRLSVEVVPSSVFRRPLQHSSLLSVHLLSVQLETIRSNFGPIQEGDCATFSAVSDTRGSTYLIFTASLTAECSTVELPGNGFCGDRNNCLQSSGATKCCQRTQIQAGKYLHVFCLLCCSFHLMENA
jgi:hypothetical protein